MAKGPYHAAFVSISDGIKMPGQGENNTLVCRYWNEDQNAFLAIIAKPEPNLEAYADKTTQWGTGGLWLCAMPWKVSAGLPCKRSLFFGYF